MSTLDEKWDEVIEVMRSVMIDPWFDGPRRLVLVAGSVARGQTVGIMRLSVQICWIKQLC